jgi:isopentenyl-diphosphate delta-isomerase type 1
MQTAMTDSDELLDIVNNDDEVIGTAPRKACHGNPALIHRAVHVLVFNSSGELLLQKRAADKDIQPGKWDTSVGGHLDPGEQYLAAAYREMSEELGLTGLPLTYLYRSFIRNRIESENVQTYLAITDDDIVYERSEISEVRFWKHDQIDQALGQGIFTPNFEEEWLMFQTHARRCLPADPDQTAFCPGTSFPDLWQELYADNCPDHG